MKKVNNKGLTLVELIVSFAIVGVAIIYFYQTISTVSKLYAKSRDDTNDFADETYVLRLMDAYCNENESTRYSCGDDDANKNEIESFCKKIDSKCSVKNLSGEELIGSKYYRKLTLELNGKNYLLLAAKTPDTTYLVNFYNSEGSLLKNITTTKKNYSNLNIPEDLKSNANRLIEINSGDNKNVKYVLNYHKKDDSFTVFFNSTELTQDNMETYATKTEDSYGNVTYTLDLYQKIGDLFSYDGNYTVIDDNNKNWSIKFLSSGTLTMNTYISTDIFLVGGGGGGANSPTTNVRSGAAGGSGGDTIVENAISLDKTKYDLIIGNGGSAEKDGGSTSFSNYNASGGKSPSSSDRGKAKGNGGDGGFDKNTTKPSCGKPGINFNNVIYGYGGAGGVGQALKTYSKTVLNCNNNAGVGGTDKSRNGSNAANNTGAGGGGAAAREGALGTTYSGGSGGSGIVVIRNKR